MEFLINIAGSVKLFPAVRLKASRLGSLYLTLYAVSKFDPFLMGNGVNFFVSWLNVTSFGVMSVEAYDAFLVLFSLFDDISFVSQVDALADILMHLNVRKAFLAIFLLVSALASA